jgi:Cu-Zn family superoxide dismutase
MTGAPYCVAVKPNRFACLAALALTGGLLVACSDGDDDGGSAAQTTVTTAPPAVTADMVAADGSPVGRVSFVETGGRLAVEASLTNLPPGFHGFHVHAVGRCERGSPAFMSAGGHMVVGDQSHPVHAGDQPVVLVLGDGTAEIRFTTDRYRLSDLLTPEGRAVIVHANADNYANIPSRYVREPDATTRSTGDAGDRIACGTVGGGGPGTTTTTTSSADATTTTGQRVTTTARAGATTTARAAATLDCQTVAFTPNSEDAASSIRATGLSCAEAEAFVRIAGGRTSSGGPAQLDVEGYSCVRTRSVQDPLPQAFYECTSGTKKVTFVRT